MTPDDRPSTERWIVEHRFLRDLTSLLSLPAFWNGTDPGFVLRTFFEALESLLALDVCYGDASVGGLRLELLRVDGRAVPLGEAAGGHVRAFAAAEPLGEASGPVEIGGRTMHCTRLPIGYVWDAGRIVVGASRSTFPDATELITLRAALSLAAAGLETARVIHERDEAQRAKDEFLAMLGHELRNPLTPIVTAVQLLSIKAGGVKSRELDVIERQVQHLRRLVDDLLDVSRITRGRIELAPERLDLADLVGRALETVAPVIERAEHEVDLQVAPGLLVDADPLRMTQVITNLLTNAAKYTPPGGRIQVIGGADGARVVLRVIDNGTGLTPELLSRVFDLFVQGPRNLARSDGGLGIGLAIVKQLVAAHGGRVAAYSEGPGRGSEFVLDLPRASAADRTAAPAAPDEADAAHPGVRVLVVDDNRDAADLAAIVLSRAGHEVATAYSGAEALALAHEQAPDVIVLDIGLPDLDGYAVAAGIAELYPGRRICIIALTGYGLPHDRRRSDAAGFSAHLVKPIDPMQLLAAVRQLVESSPSPCPGPADTAIR